MSRVQKLFGLGMRSSMWLPRGNTRPGVTTPAVSFKYLKVRMELHEPRRRIGNVLVDLGVLVNHMPGMTSLAAASKSFEMARMECP